jgi:hypothetical protein
VFKELDQHAEGLARGLLGLDIQKCDREGKQRQVVEKEMKG